MMKFEKETLTRPHVGICDTLNHNTTYATWEPVVASACIYNKGQIVAHIDEVLTEYGAVRATVVIAATLLVE